MPLLPFIPSNIFIVIGASHSLQLWSYLSIAPCFLFLAFLHLISLLHSLELPYRHHISPLPFVILALLYVPVHLLCPCICLIASLSRRWCHNPICSLLGLINPPLSNIVYLVIFPNLGGYYHYTRVWETHLWVIYPLLHLYAWVYVSLGPIPTL